ncbi:uncharacterized protein [Amphiura filiformis]|uniref:uncharacterized protein n=1 Tax=Amphiura filiformis TaxID=82378 RepID=UPI003B21B8A0
MSMRRAKIRPSINLAASRPRRNVPTPASAAPSTDRSLKSPAKSLSSDRSLRSPAKAVPSDRSLKSPSKTVASPVKAAPSTSVTQRASRSSSSSVETSAAPVTRQTSVSKQSVAASGEISKNDDASQEIVTSVPNKQIPEQSSPKRALTTKAASILSEPEANKQNDKPQAPAAPSAPKVPLRGRRKPAPNIPNRRPRQQPAPIISKSTSNSSDKAKESSSEKPGGSDAPDLANITDGGAVTEPPPVQRVVDRPDIPPMPLPKPSDAPAPRNTITSKSSESQSFPIHHDAPAVTKTASAAVTKATSSAVTKATTTKSTSAPLRTIGPPEKKNPMNIYERKLRELKETLEEETPAKRRRRYVKKNMPSDRSNMTMSDLIYYNPKNNPMKQSGPGTENRERSRTSSETVIDMNKDGSGEDEDDNVDQFAPQVKIGPDGELILDQKSLVKDASPRKTFDPSDSDIVHEEFSSTTYASFRKQTRTATWTKKETEKFYKALSAVGTDFSMINAMFPKRTRHQIKNKFKREERSHRYKVDAAIRKTSKVSMSMFVPSDEDSESETENRPTRVSKTKSKKRHPSGNTANAQKQAETESVADETENTPASITRTNESDDEEIAPSENGDNISEYPPPPPPESKQESDDSEEDISMETILSRPTRSGRQPKMRTNFTIQEEASTRVNARSKGTIRAKPVKPAKPNPSYEQQKLQKPQEQSFVAGKSQTTPKTPSSQTFVTPTTTPRKVASIQHIIINSPVVPSTAPVLQNPSPIKTHIYVINSPDGTQRIVQLPVGNTIATPPVRSNVRSNASSPIVIHRVQASQPMSLQNANSSPAMTSQNGVMLTQSGIVSPQSITTAPSHNVIAPAQRSIHVVPTQSIVPVSPQHVVSSPAVRSMASPIVTSSLANSSAVKHFMVVPPKVQRRPLVSQDNTVINIAPRMTTQVAPQHHHQQIHHQQQQQQHIQQQHIQLAGTSSTSAVNIAPRVATRVTPQRSHQQIHHQQHIQQQQHIQLPVTSSASDDCVILQLHQHQETDVEHISDRIIAQQVDVECLDRMSDSGASESGAFIPPVAGRKHTMNFSAMEQNSDQLIITGLGNEGLSTRDIFDQISYEQGVVVTGHETVAANMTISEDMISQIATEIAIEK